MYGQPCANHSYGMLKNDVVPELLWARRWGRSHRRALNEDGLFVLRGLLPAKDLIEIRGMIEQVSHSLAGPAR